MNSFLLADSANEGLKGAREKGVRSLIGLQKKSNRRIGFSPFKSALKSWFSRTSVWLKVDEVVGSTLEFCFWLKLLQLLERFSLEDFVALVTFSHCIYTGKHCCFFSPKSHYSFWWILYEGPGQAFICSFVFVK